LNTVDHDARGMAVTDDGTVTAPTVPGLHRGQVDAVLLQMELDQHAQQLQHRFRGILTDFAALDTRAATELADATAQLAALRAAPTGGRLGPQVASIVDGVGTLPADPARLREFWAALSPAEKDALYQRDPHLGNRDGIPQSDRDYYNRETLRTYCGEAESAQASAAQVEHDHPRWAAGNGPQPEEPDYPAWLSYRELTREADKAPRLRALAHALDGDGDPPRYLTELGADHALVAIGDPEGAHRVLQAPPGPSTPAEALDRAVAAYRAALAADPAARLTVIARVDS
jgi:hypothetical protein